MAARYNNLKIISERQTLPIGKILPGMIVTFNYSEQNVTDPRPLLLFLHHNKEIKVLGKQSLGMFYVGSDSMMSGNYISKHDKKIAQQKPRFEPTFVIPPLPSVDVGGNIPSGPNPRPRSGKSTKSKSIPSNNPRNFYTLFSAIQYNCTAHFWGKINGKSRTTKG